MRWTIKKDRFMYAFFSLVVLSMVLLAYDKYNIKIGLFALFVLANLGIILTDVLNIKKYGMLFFMMAVYSTVIVVISTVMTEGDISSAIHAEYVNFYLLLVYICLRSNFDVYKAFYNALSVLIVIILSIAILDFLKIVDLYKNPLVMLINNNQEGKISKSVNAIFYYVIFMNTSPLLLFHFVYSIVKKKYIWMGLSFIALLLTGTRANIYIALAIIPAYFMVISKGKMKKAFMLFLIMCIVAVGAGFMYERIQIINLAKSSGDAVRSRIAPSILEALNSDWMYWVFGMGHGSQYYSYGRETIVTTSELSYYEMLRTVGILGTIPFLVFLFMPVKRIFFSDKRWLLLPYGAILVESIIDPFLHTSTSFVMYILVYYTYYKLKNESNFYNEELKNIREKNSMSRKMGGIWSGYTFSGN